MQAYYMSSTLSLCASWPVCTHNRILQRSRARVTAMNALYGRHHRWVINLQVGLTASISALRCPKNNSPY